MLLQLLLLALVSCVSSANLKGEEAPKFTCNDGCEIYDNNENDDYCDCTECEDERSWTCDSCTGGCPAECTPYGGIDMCTGSAPMTVCDDGCEIYEAMLNDNYCDCLNCEDENAWDCDSCGGCPVDCGKTVQCVEQTTTTLLPTTLKPTTTETPTTTKVTTTTETPPTTTTTEEPETTEVLATTKDETTEAPPATTQTTDGRADDAMAAHLLLAAAFSLLSAMAL